MPSRVLAYPPQGSDLDPVRGGSYVPYLGDLVRMTRDPHRFFSERYARIGSVSWGVVAGMPTVYAQGPDAAEAVLVDRDKAFIAGPAYDLVLGRLFPGGLVLMDREEHLYRRRIVQQVFTASRVRGYQERVALLVCRELRQWCPGPRFTVFDNIKRLTLGATLEAITGLSAEREDTARMSEAFQTLVRGVSAYVRYPVPGLRMSRALKARRFLVEALQRQLPEKRRSGGDDLFAALCTAQTEDGDRFTDDEIINTVLSLVFAAHDTTTSTLTSAIYYLAKHPQWQSRLREEPRTHQADTAPTGCPSGKSAPRLEDSTAPQTVDLVIKEAQRLVSPTLGAGRRTVKDTSILGHHIPSGVNVLIPLITNHYLPQYWPDPTVFDPERFAPHRREDKIHKYAWQAFGGGAHACIGIQFANMATKTILQQLLQHYSWSVPATYKWDLDFTSLPSPKDGLPVDLKPLS